MPGLLDTHYLVIHPHSGLDEMNISVGTGGGNFTSVVDWPGVSFDVLGFNLYALKNAFGGEWSAYTLIRYGTACDCGFLGMNWVRDSNADKGFRHLDALLS
ncbi:hypothetical protein F4802DRAFT_612970 [Xylaria palmicola]|nr:hypothetical protein F4802DRAFT_612970 [Xylaria palmicola]